MAETANFDHYEVLTREDGSLFELGRGGMGITYKAFDTNLKMTVALKVINATYLQSEVAQQRFKREAQSAAKLRNRHVASVFHLKAEGNVWFYAMEFIDGETLGALIKRQGSLDPVFALKVTAQVARALNAASQHGLVHRDIKPDNLMLVEDDDELVVKVIDFGLAKTAVTDEDALTVSMGGFVGTAHFASPEQWEDKEIDTRSDIYSLGVTLWYMLTGQAPFSGSMPQVMTKHLSAPPPFEKLANVPSMVVDLLRKMLEKNPEDRFQTPVDLRRATEKALTAISARTASVPPSQEVIAPHEDSEFPVLKVDPPSPSSHPSHTGDSSHPSHSSQSRAGNFETNSTIANRYQVGPSFGETSAGHVFRAYDIERKIEVRLIVLHPETLGDNTALNRIEQMVEKVAPVQHPNLLRVFAYETVDRGSFLVVEWTEGFTLLELLKARRVLQADEALRLLSQAATGVDYALSQGLNCLDLGLHQVQIHFAQPIEKETLLRAPLSTWPEFVLKLYPLGGTQEMASSLTWAGAQTMVWGLDSHHAEDDTRPEYIQALAMIAYETLGGMLSPFDLRGSSNPATRYTPLATLNEEGNEVVRRALDRSRSFSSAQEFISALGKLDDPHVRRHDAPRSSRARISAGPVPPLPSIPQAPVMREPAPPEPPQRKRPPVVLISILVLVVSGAGIFFLFHLQPKKVIAITPTPSPRTVTPTPSPRIVTPTPSPRIVTPTPSPTLPPKPTREESLLAASKAAEGLEARGEWAKALEKCLEIAKNYPESPVGKNHLESLLEHLRARPSPITMEEFQAMRQKITEAAGMDNLSAMLLLGDNLHWTEQKEAFDWYSEAAQKGNVTAEVALGFMLLRGMGADKPDPANANPVKAFEYFQSAASKGDVGGKFALGLCYRGITGVPKDPKRAITLLREAADAGDARAMSSLGDMLKHDEGGIGNKKEAADLFTRAMKLGNLNATANLGVLYIEGLGVPKNPKKAAELFAAGAKVEETLTASAQAEYNACMEFYAKCLESGIGVAKNLEEAQKWYVKAAKVGNRASMDWCKEHNIPVPGSP